MPSLELNQLTKKFGTITAVDHLSLAVEEGEIFGLLGPNGAGKTTTLRILACLISPSEGSAKVGGYEIAQEPQKVREIVGILTENPSLYERLTAYENLDFFAEAYGLSDNHKRRDAIRELLESFGLWERRDSKVVTFSKGMKQRLAIARTLVHNPPILFLDEPTTGLDPESAKEIRELVARLGHRERHTILLCTHRLEDAAKLCSRVTIINQGRAIAIGTPEELQGNIAGEPTLQISLREINSFIVRAVKEIKEVREVMPNHGEGTLTITVDDLNGSTPEVVRRIVEAGGMVLSVNAIKPSLEEAYLKLVREKTP